MEGEGFPNLTQNTIVQAEGGPDLSGYSLLVFTDTVRTTDGVRVDAIKARAGLLPDVLTIAASFGISEESVKQALAYAVDRRNFGPANENIMALRTRTVSTSVKRRSMAPRFSYPEV